ncbi:carbohydrate ABC transporter permease [Cryptosporangium aurantiacum]|uniref:Carbohydrate ABC transporter membrane protein 1, CUT1 family n=1 Tax=Cryptosporangium aurantiacum TaxID=134849 RepID=A0A1M7RLU9_9ACTN|nr:sugar ABC transporter permease [Cryptosporangium aurantiacum]SHN47297.1 carbohydrate ABC transporter membrane protein 1, CUT1 family [Cryptosporangium aurantiacum]
MTLEKTEPRLAPPVGGSDRRRERRPHRQTHWLYLTPGLALLAAWVYLPVVLTLALSVLDWHLIRGEGTFVGTDNFRRLFADPEFRSASLRTVAYAVALLPFATVAPFAMAVLLWKHDGPAARVYRALLFLPVVLAPVATAVSWRFLLDPLQGLANAALDVVAIPPVNWLGEGGSAFGVIVVLTGTKIFALNTLLYLAGLAGIDRRLLEAARVDGATEWDVTRRLVVPLLGRTTALVTFLCLVLAGQWAFVNVAVLTQGGPSGATDNVYYHLYDYAFDYFDTGLAAAAAVLLVVVFVPISLAYQRAGRRTPGGAG